MGETRNKKDERGLLILAILFTAFQAASLICFDVWGDLDLAWNVVSVIQMVMCFMMYASYRRHNKNVMKPLLGAALMLLLYARVDKAMYYLQYYKEFMAQYSNKSAVLIYIILELALMVVLILMNIMHYSINSSHHSSPKKIKTNRAFYIIYIVLTVGRAVMTLLVGSFSIVGFGSFVGVIADLFMIGIVISIESKLDGYRLEREAAE